MAQVAVCSQINTKHINTVWAERTVVECYTGGRVETESGGTRRRTGGEVKGKEANGVGSQAVFSLTRNSPSSVTTIVLLRTALQESQYPTELTPPPI